MLSWTDRYGRIRCSCSLRWTCFVPSRRLVRLILSTVSRFSLLTKSIWALTLIMLTIPMFRFVACLRCLWVETRWLWVMLAAVRLNLNTWIVAMSLTQYFRIVLILSKFILVLIHYLLDGVLASFTTSSWPAQVIYRATSCILSLVVHGLWLHVLMEIILLLEVTCGLRAGLVGSSCWNDVSWLRSTWLLWWISIVSLIELLSRMLFVIVWIISVLVTRMFRMALLSITTRLRILSILARSTSSKITLPRLWCLTTNPISWIYWICFPLARNTSLVFISDVLIWLIHLLAFRYRLFSGATVTYSCCTSQSSWLGSWCQLLLGSILWRTTIKAEIIWIWVKVPF